MTAPRTPDELARLVEQATPGPWEWIKPYGFDANNVSHITVDDDGESLRISDADAAVIVALRNDAPRLVADSAALAKAREAIRDCLAMVDGFERVGDRINAYEIHECLDGVL